VNKQTKTDMKTAEIKGEGDDEGQIKNKLET
jgi:hypothetical protein